MSTTALQKQKTPSVKPQISNLVKSNMGGRPYRAASLFSGSGGMDLGFEHAGFEVVWANDVNHWA